MLQVIIVNVYCMIWQCFGLYILHYYFVVWLFKIQINNFIVNNIITQAVVYLENFAF